MKLSYTFVYYWGEEYVWLYSIPKSVYGETVVHKQSVDCLNVGRVAQPV